MISNYYSLVSGIFLLVLAAFVLSKNYHKKLYQLFFWMSVSLSIWLLATFMLFTAQDDTTAIFWDRVIYAGIVFFPTLLFHFVITFTERKKSSLVIPGYILSFFFLLVSQTDYFVSGLFRYEWGVHTRAQIFHHFFLLFFFSYIFVAFYHLIDFYRHTPNRIQKIQSKYILIAFILLVSIGILGYLPAYGIGIYPFAYFSGLIFSVIVGYAIVRYRFLSLQLILKSGFIYGLSFVLSIFAFVYFVYFLQRNFLDRLVGSDFIVQIIGIALFLIFFYILKNNLRKVIDRMWPHNDIDVIAMFSKIHRDVSQQPEIEKRLSFLNRDIAKHFDMQWAALFVSGKKRAVEHVVSWPDHVHLTRDQYQAIFADFSGRGSLIISDELPFRGQKGKYERLKKWGVSALLFIESEGIYEGVMVLGPKKNPADIWFKDKIDILANVRIKIQESVGWIVVYDDAVQGLHNLVAKK